MLWWLSHREGRDAVTWCGWDKLWKGRTFWKSRLRCQVYGLRGVSWWLRVCFILLDMTTPPWCKEKVVVYYYYYYKMSKRKVKMIYKINKLIFDLLNVLLESGVRTFFPNSWHVIIIVLLQLVWHEYPLNSDSTPENSPKLRLHTRKSSKLRLHTRKSSKPTPLTWKSSKLWLH